MYFVTELKLIVLCCMATRRLAGSDRPVHDYVKVMFVVYARLCWIRCLWDISLNRAHAHGNFGDQMQEEPAEAKVMSAEMVDMVEGTYFVCGVHVVLDAVENWYKQKHSADVTWEIHVMGQKCTKVWKKLIVHLSKFICWRQLSLCMLWTVWDVEKKVSEFTLLHILLYVCHNKILSAEVTVRCYAIHMRTVQSVCASCDCEIVTAEMTVTCGQYVDSIKCMCNVWDFWKQKWQWGLMPYMCGQC